MKQTKMPMFILEGNGSFFNRGCEAIFLSTVTMLRDEFGPCHIINAPYSSLQPINFTECDPNITHVLPAPYKPLHRWTRNWWYLQFNRMVLGKSTPRTHFADYLSNASAVLGLGGDNYSLDYGVPQSFFDTSDYVLNKGKPFVLWGATVGPFSSFPDFEESATKKLKRMTLICARETETVNYLRQLGIQDNVRLMADPAFLLDPIRPATAVADWVQQQRVVGINLSPLIGRYFADLDTWLREATKCVEAVLEAIDLPVLLIPHVIYENSDANDYKFLLEIRNRLNHYGDRLKILEPTHSAGNLKWIIGHLEVFAGARTHSTIAALSSNVPTLCIAYSMKAKGLVRDIYGHQDWLLSVEELQPSEFAYRIKLLIFSASSIRQQLETVIPEQKAKARYASAHLRKVLKQ